MIHRSIHMAARLSLLALVAAFVVLPRARGAEVAAFSGQVKEPAEHGVQTAVFAGGCFWGVDAVFKHVLGVENVVSGYAGGDARTAEYETVSTGSTGHAESVQVTYDSAKISYPRLLQIFFAVAHDPTTLNRQGPDVGNQYRSAVFYASEYQNQVTKAYIEQLDGTKTFASRIVTQVTPLKKFYPAENYHQNYLARNPNSLYIVFNDLPKLTKLRTRFPEVYR